MPTQVNRCGYSAWQALYGVFMLMLFFPSAAAASSLTGLLCEFSRNAILQQSEVYLNSQTLLSGEKKLLSALTENIHWVFLEDSPWGWRKTCAQSTMATDGTSSLFSFVLIKKPWSDFMILPLSHSFGILMFLLPVWWKSDSWVPIKKWVKPRSQDKFGYDDSESEGLSSSYLLAQPQL